MKQLLLLVLLWTLQAPAEVHVDPDTGDRYQLERPEGAARGRWPVPEWVVWAVGGAVLTGAGATLIARLRRKRSR